MKRDRLSLPFYIFSLIFSLFVFVYFISTINANGLYEILNSDGLFMPSLYKDLFQDGYSIIGRNFTTTANFFPHFILFSIFNYITGDFIVAMLLHGFIQYFLFMLAVNYLIKVTNKNISYYTLALSNLFIALLPLHSLITGDFFLSMLMFMPYHFGSLIVTLFSIVLVMKYLQKPRLSFVVVIWILTLIMVFSDRIFLLYFSASVGAVLIYFFTIREIRKYAVYLFLNILGSAVLGIIIFNIVLSLKYISYSSTNMFVLDQIIPSFALMSKYFLNTILDCSIKGLVFQISCLTFLILLVYSIYNVIYKRSQNLKFSLLFLFCIFFSAGVWITPGLNGTFSNFTIVRYNIQVIYLLIAFTPFVLDYIVNRVNLPKYLYFTVQFLLLITFAIPFYADPNLKNNLENITNYYPNDVAKIDSICKANNLHRGIGEYWTANRTTMFSKQNVKIATCYWDLNPRPHNANMNWFFDVKNKKRGKTFDFVIVEKSDSLAVKAARLTLRSKDYSEIDCGNYFIVKTKFYYEYNRPYIIREDRKLIGYELINFDSVKRDSTYKLDQMQNTSVKFFMNSEYTAIDKKNKLVANRPTVFLSINMDSTEKEDDYLIELFSKSENNSIKIEAFNNERNYSIENSQYLKKDSLDWDYTYLDFKVQQRSSKQMQIVIESKGAGYTIIDRIKISRFKNI